VYACVSKGLMGAPASVTSFKCLSAFLFRSSESLLISSRHFAQKCRMLRFRMIKFIFFLIFFNFVCVNPESPGRGADTLDSLSRLILVEIRVSGIHGWKSKRACFRCREKVFAVVEFGIPGVKITWSICIYIVHAGTLHRNIYAQYTRHNVHDTRATRMYVPLLYHGVG